MAVIKRVRLSEIAELVTKGTTPTTLGYEFQDTGVNFLKIECFSEKGDYIQNKATHISEECHEKLKRSQLKEGDILFSIAGVIGRVAIVTRNMLPANINQALAIIRIKKDDIYLPYVKLILTSPLIKKQFERKKQGVAQLNISLKDINDLEIPLPEIGKQIEYANSFKKVEKLIYTRQYQLQKLDELVKARFVELFGSVDDNQKNIKTIRVGDACTLINGRAFKPDEWSTEGLPIVRIQNLNSEEAPFNYYSGEVKSQHLINSGDLLFSWSGTPGTSFGAFFWRRGKAALNQHIFKVIPNCDYNLFFLQYALNERLNFIISRAHGGVGLQHITKKELDEVLLFQPGINEQNDFATFVEQVDKSKLLQFFCFPI